MCKKSRRKGDEPSTRCGICYEWVKCSRISQHNRKHAGQINCPICDEKVSLLKFCVHLRGKHAAATGLYHGSSAESIRTDPIRQINLEEELAKIDNNNGWKVLKKRKFAMLYDEVNHTPRVGLQHLTKADKVNNLKTSVRIDYFEDKALKVGVAPRGYRTFGCVPGHVIPYANCRCSQTDADDTMTTANTSPQDPRTNAGSHSKTQQHGRNLLDYWDEVVMAAGPVIDESTPKETTTNSLEVFKPVSDFIIYRMERFGDDPLVLAFLVPHKYIKKPYMSFITTVEEIERLTGANLAYFKGLENTWNRSVKLFSCPRFGCFQAFESKADLDDHLVGHQWRCRLCFNAFQTSKEVEDHKQFHVRCCDQCGKKFPNKECLRTHKIFVHNTERPFPCQYSGCGKKFKTNALRLRHVREAHKGTRVFCKCGRSFARKEVLKGHQEYACKLLAVITETDQSVVSKHMNEMRFPCPWPGCKRTFKYKTQVNRHTREYHRKVRYTCSCGAKYVRRVDLVIHLKTCKGHEVKTDQSSNVSIPAPDVPHVHIVVDTKKEDFKYPCPWAGCKKTFTDRNSVKRHTKADHEGFRYTCSCGAKYVGREDLGRHLKTCTGYEVKTDQSTTTVSIPTPDVPNGNIAVDSSSNVVRFACTWPGCKKTFKDRYYIKKHIKTEHEGFRFTCSCGAKYVDRFRLNTHLKTCDGHEVKTDQSPKPTSTLSQAETEESPCLSSSGNQSCSAASVSALKVDNAKARGTKTNDDEAAKSSGESTIRASSSSCRPVQGGRIVVDNRGDSWIDCGSHVSSQAESGESLSRPVPSTSRASMMGTEPGISLPSTSSSYPAASSQNAAGVGVPELITLDDGDEDFQDDASRNNRSVPKTTQSRKRKGPSLTSRDAIRKGRYDDGTPKIAKFFTKKSGNINLAIHLRGHKRDFDNWANITGDPSWSHEGVVPFFKAHEDYRGPGDEKYHGYNGDLRIEAPDYVGMGYDFVRAAEELGFKNVDLNGAPFTEGFDIIRFPIKRGVRQAPYKAFLEPALTRKTLTVRRYAHVNRILFKDGNTAYGIQYDRHGQKLVAFASKEVIITAGCMGTPKLLMLSGIGPAEHLNNLGIPVLADLPVGENLQDHLGVYLSYFTLEQPRSVLLERDLTVTQFSDWVFKGEGILTSPGCQATGVFSSSLAKARGEGDWPDLQFFFFGYAAFQNSPKHVSRLFNLKEDEITEYYKTSIGKDGAHIIVTGSRPYSRGYIRLGGSSPYDKIIIQPNYLADPDDTDFKALKEGVQKGLELMENTEAFRKLGARFNNVSLPGCQHLEFRSDPYWECFIRRFSVTLHHPGGTAAMGSVVTPELKVIGVQNLRVMDTSVEPQIPITNTQASTMMIAEKGSFLILEQWKDNNIVK